MNCRVRFPHELVSRKRMFCGVFAKRIKQVCAAVLKANGDKQNQKS